MICKVQRTAWRTVLGLAVYKRHKPAIACQAIHSVDCKVACALCCTQVAASRSLHQQSSVVRTVAKAHMSMHEHNLSFATSMPPECGYGVHQVLCCCIFLAVYSLPSPAIQPRYAPFLGVGSFWVNMRQLKSNSWNDEDTRKWSDTLAAGKAGGFAQHGSKRR